jgi:hypothetical protein
MGPQSRGCPNFGKFRTPIWESRDKNAIWESRDKNAIWMWASWKGTKYTIKGEDGGFPQVWAMVSLVSSSLHVVPPRIKNVPTMH